MEDGRRTERLLLSDLLLGLSLNLYSCGPLKRLYVALLLSERAPPAGRELGEQLDEGGGDGYK